MIRIDKEKRWDSRYLNYNEAPRHFLLNIIRIALGFAILLIGQINPDERLMIAGLPINTLFFFIAILLSLSTKQSLTTMLILLTWTSPIIFLMISLAWSPLPDYGIYKLSNLIISSLLTATLLTQAINNIGLKLAFKIVNLILLALLTSAIAYKLMYGFFDRSTPFLLNGPITFGRLMGLGAIISLIFFSSKLRWAFYSLFALATIWTASKGPVLSLLAITLFYIIWNANKRTIAFTALITSIALIFTLENINSLKDLPVLGRYGIALEHFTNPEINADQLTYGSIGIRSEIFKSTIELISHSPWGVGLGGWSAHTGTQPYITYPHNLFLELISEGGWLLGCIALIPFISFISKPKRPLFFVASFYFLAQQVSGDLLDARFLLVFSLLTIIKFKPRTGGQSLPSLHRSTTHQDVVLTQKSIQKCY